MLWFGFKLCFQVAKNTVFLLKRGAQEWWMEGHHCNIFCQLVLLWCSIEGIDKNVIFALLFQYNCAIPPKNNPSSHYFLLSRLSILGHYLWQYTSNCTRRERIVSSPPRVVVGADTFYIFMMKTSSFSTLPAPKFAFVSFGRKAFEKKRKKYPCCFVVFREE